MTCPRNDQDGRIEHCALFDPDQGYLVALRIPNTLYGNARVISDVSMSRQTKGLPSRKKTVTTSVSVLSSNSNMERKKLASALAAL